MKKDMKMIIAFLAPAVIIFASIFIYPIIRTFAMSFFSIGSVTADIGSWEFAGIDNYIKIFNTPLFIDSLVNLFKIWAIGGIIVMTFGLFFAVVLSSGVRGKKIFRAIIYLPNIISAVALGTMWIHGVFNTDVGMLNTFFDAIGLDAFAKTQWLSSDLKFTALLIAYSFGSIGYHMLIFLSGIERIGKEYYEAATIDGANKIKQFRYVTLPLLKGVFRTNLIMWSISSVGFFIWSQLFSPVGADRSTITPMVYMYTEIFGTQTTAVVERDAGVGATVGVILCIIVILVFWILNKTLKDKDIEF